jgi:hypothetical protein
MAAFPVSPHLAGRPTALGVKLPYCIFTPECDILSARHRKDISIMFVGRETELGGIREAADAR